ncbi:hypothetical protein HYPGJ_21096 [Hyphomicrobium sp. GJ21]|nr:hypothetical protein HYPGJ_21096 [Hyphomicrobium sp. GJ21]
MNDLDRPLSLLGVSLQKIVDRCGIGRVARDLDALRPPAREHVTLQPMPGQQRRRLIAHRVEPHQPEREALRHLLRRRRMGIFLVLGQQQARFQKRKPSRHDEIIGRDLELQLLRFSDECEILLDQRQNGNFGEVDLLRSRKRQQKIERPFEALDIDEKCLASGRHAVQAWALPVLRTSGLSARLGLSYRFDHLRLDLVPMRRPVRDLPADITLIQTGASPCTGVRSYLTKVAAPTMARAPRRGTHARLSQSPELQSADPAAQYDVTQQLE